MWISKKKLSNINIFANDIINFGFVTHWLTQSHNVKIEWTFMYSLGWISSVISNLKHWMSFAHRISNSVLRYRTYWDWWIKQNINFVEDQGTNFSSKKFHGFSNDCSFFFLQNKYLRFGIKPFLTTSLMPCTADTTSAMCVLPLLGFLGALCPVIALTTAWRNLKIKTNDKYISCWSLYACRYIKMYKQIC